MLTYSKHDSNVTEIIKAIVAARNFSNVRDTDLFFF